MATSQKDIERSRIGIKNLFAYHPKVRCGFLNPFHQGESAILVSLKNGAPLAIAHFGRLLAAWLPEGVVVCTVPSSDPANTLPGIRRAAQLAARVGGRTDGTGCLVRVAPTAPAHLGNRSRASQLATLYVDHAELIHGRKVVVVDDVTTSGSSLAAAREVLLAAGAREVLLRALGATYYYGQRVAV